MGARDHALDQIKHYTKLLEYPRRWCQVRMLSRSYPDERMAGVMVSHPLNSSMNVTLEGDVLRLVRKLQAEQSSLDGLELQVDAFAHVYDVRRVDNEMFIRAHWAE